MPVQPTATKTREPDGILVLADGTVFRGYGVGAEGEAVGEIVFNTAMTGYQEVLTDPSYAGQIITFTFPHIGNVGTNEEDIETATPAARGLVIRADITEPANYRASRHLDAWLRSHDLVGISGLDTRALTRRIRDGGAPNGVIAHRSDGAFDVDALRRKAADWPGLVGMDLAKEVTCRQSYGWDEGVWRPGQPNGQGYGSRPQTDAPAYRVVAMDFGIKRNILRNLTNLNCEVTVVPADATAEDILRHAPDGVFLSNGPGDPEATGAYAIPTLKALLEKPDLPLFGICLGHQMLALALGAHTAKMHHGHHGANHPVKDLATGRVEITSQNHGFVVDENSLPAGVVPSHVSLFDGSNEGLRVEGRPVFSVQYHPEASPGPRDSHYLFERFVDAMSERKKKGGA